ncbi:MAG: hypothetical protein ACKOA2_02180 [Ilumatobacteraceae bacterium]
MLDPLRTAALRHAKLVALVGDHTGASPRDVEFAGGAAVAHGDEIFVLAADRRLLGGALVIAARRSAPRLHVVAESEAGILARRAPHWSLPVEVWEPDGRTLRSATPVDAPAPVALPSAHGQFVEVIAAAGADPVVEHGVLTGEVAGLEVCRVVDDPSSGEARLEVGTGAHDREIFAMLHADRPTVDALADVVASVAAVRLARSSGDRAHPLARLAPERALRARLVADPALVGACEVRPAPPPVPRTNLVDPAPSVAVATAPDGTETMLVCSAGVDLDAVPVAVDVRLSSALPTTLVVPARDAVPAQRLLASLAAPPITVVALAP